VAAGSSEGSSPPAEPSRTFFRVRVAVLLLILAGVLLYAWRDHRSRTLRNDWSRTLDVALVLVSPDVSPEVAAGLRDRSSALEDLLAEQMQRWRPGAAAPFDVTVLEARVAATPPAPPEEGLIAAARYAWDLSRFTSSLDDAAGLDRRFDARIYVLARTPVDARRKSVEGFGEQGGRVGVIEVELDDAMIDFALFVATHELMHTLGASDRYDATGEPQVPDGLADPQRDPLYPQDGAEIMARHRAVSPGRSEPPEALEELVVGELTAREIGWLTGP
jgi:hypothetical protein